MYRSTPVIDDACQMLLLAKDGVYLPTAPRAITQGMLASGNRADVLINCPEQGEFKFKSTKLGNKVSFTSAFRERPTAVLEGVLLKITAVASEAPEFIPQCDLPEFIVNRPCCD